MKCCTPRFCMPNIIYMAAVKPLPCISKHYAFFFFPCCLYINPWTERDILFFKLHAIWQHGDRSIFEKYAVPPPVCLLQRQSSITNCLCSRREETLLLFQGSRVENDHQCSLDLSTALFWYTIWDYRSYVPFRFFPTCCCADASIHQIADCINSPCPTPLCK